MHVPTRRVVALAAACALVAAGCTSPAKLDLAYAASTPARSENPVIARVCFLPITDERDARDAGSFGGRLVEVQNAISWCQAALGSLASDSVRLAETPPATGSDELVAYPRLRKLYVEGVTTSMAAAVVIEVEYRQPGHARFRRVYRGRDVAMNWFSAGGEARAAFATAIEQCIRLIRADLQNGSLVQTSDSPLATKA